MSFRCALCLLILIGVDGSLPADAAASGQAGLGPYPRFSHSWAQVFGGAGADRAEDAAPAPGGGVFVAGTTFSFGSGTSDGWVARVGHQGAAQWELALGGSDADEFSSVAATPDGGCVLVGFTRSSGAGGTDGWIVKLAGNGSLQWQKTFGTTADESFLKVSVSASTSLAPQYYVGGAVESAATGRDAWVLKLDAGGDPLWQETFGGKLDDGVSAITAISGGVLLVVSSNSALGGAGVPFFRPWLVQLDGSGNPLLQRTFDFSGGDVLSDVVELADGGFALTGEILAAAFFRGDVWVLRLDSSLDVVWDRRFGDNFQNLFVDAGRRVRELPRGGLLVAGSTGTAGAGSEDLWLLRLDPAGHLLWNRTLGNSGFDGGNGLALGPTGIVYVAGFAQAPGLGSLDAFLARVTPSLQPLGAAACPPTGPGAPNEWSSPLSIGAPAALPAPTNVSPAPGAGLVTLLATGAFLCP